MKYCLMGLLFFTTITVTAQPAAKNYLVTDKQFGAITKLTTFQDLITLFGKDKIRDETRTGAEGEGEYKCTVINKNTPQEITVFWLAGKLHSKLTGVECTQAKSGYYTADSLKIGSTLSALVKANKAVISFYGFAWDYGGTITSFHQGKYEGSKIHFGIDWQPKGDDTSLMGEAELNSNMSKVQKRAARISITRIEVEF